MRVLILLALMRQATVVADIRADRETIDAWLRDGKFDQATLLCREQISAAPQDVASQAAYTAELIRVLTEQARLSAAEKSSRLWEQALDVGDRFASQHSRHPHTLIVSFQTALARLTQTEYEFRTATAIDQRRDALLRMIRGGLRRWESVGEQAASRLRSGGEGQGAPDAALGRNTLRSLQDRVRHYQARALLVRASLHEAGSNDRLYACRQAIELLEKIAPNNVGARFAATRVDLVRCLRLRGDLDGVEIEVERLLQGPALARCERQALWAERLRAAADASDWRSVERQLVSTDGDAPSDQIDCPEWSVAQLEALVALGKQSDRRSAADWSDKTREQLRLITERYDSYWVRVAEAVVSNGLSGSIAADDSSGTAGNLAILSDLARVRLQQGDVPGAIDALEESAEAAHAQGADEQAWQLRFDAAKLRLREGEFAESLTSLAQLAQSPHAPPVQPDAEGGASAAQMLAIKAAALGVRSKAVSVGAYRGQMRQYLSQWPTAAAASQVHDWLARLYAAEGNYNEAITNFTAIAVDDPRAVAVVEEVGRASRALLWMDADEARRKAIQQGMTWLKDIKSRSGDGAQPAAVWYVRLMWLDGREVSAAERRTLETTNAVLSPQLAEMRDGLLWVSRALQRDFTAAGQMLESFQSSDADLWSDFVSILEPQLPSAAAVVKLAVARAQQQAEPSAEQARHWSMAAARAELALSNFAQAILITEELVGDYPTRLDVQELRALALSDGDQDQQQQALSIWQQLVRAFPKASAGWYRAKLGLAQTHVRLGNAEAAAKTIALTRALYPELGGPELAQRFEALQREIGAANR